MIRWTCVSPRNYKAVTASATCVVFGSNLPRKRVFWAWAAHGPHGFEKDVELTLQRAKRAALNASQSFAVKALTKELAREGSRND